MFDQIIDKYVNRWTPTVRNGADVARTYMDAILCRLDDIREAVQSEDYDERRVSFYAPNGGLVAGTAVEITQVPVGRTWELENISVLNACSITITESNAFKFAKQFSTADFTKPGIIFQPGNIIDIVSTGNAAPVPVYMQFRVKTLRRPRNNIRNAGTFQNPSVSEKVTQEVDNLHRHFVSGDMVEGRNAVGERAV